MIKTAILFSGTAYNFNFSIKSLNENLVIPNDADVFILTSRYNIRRKAPETLDLVSSENSTEWHNKTTTMVRDESKTLSDSDVELIKNTFGDRLKGIFFIEDMPEYMGYILEERTKMMNLVNSYRAESIQFGLPTPFGGNVGTPDDGNVRCVIDQYNHIKKCFELMEQYESDNGIKYDYVMRARIDFVTPKVFNISKYYLNQDHPYLYVCGSVRRDVFEWSDEFCFFAKRITADKLFKNLNLIGSISNRKYNTVYTEQNNDFMFAPETQFSLLLYELEINIINVKIYRSACFSDGKDGFHYMNYMFKWGDIQLEYEYKLACDGVTDINEHLPILKEYGEKCNHITELGTRYGNSTLAFMSARPSKFITYDVANNPRIDYLKEIADESGINFEVKLESPSEIEETDFLFIDTNHFAEQCREELRLHSPRVSKYIGFHDTETFWEKGQGYEKGEGLRYAIEPFLKNNPEWEVVYKVSNNNGLLIIKRK